MAREPQNLAFCAPNKKRGRVPRCGYINPAPFQTVGQLDKKFLGDLAFGDVFPILPLDGLHLVPQPQFQLLQPDFF